MPVSWKIYLIHPFARRPSLLCREVGVHHRTFGACSGFTRVTARGFAREPFAPFFSEASPRRITPLRRSVAMELNRQLLQRNFHPLDTSAFRGALQSFPRGVSVSNSDAPMGLKTLIESHHMSENDENCSRCKHPMSQHQRESDADENNGSEIEMRGPCEVRTCFCSQFSPPWRDE
jgi:hypothetical protein